ncbi:ECF transporter S component [Acholeplasma equirhinis]|uniref:ECF transporter S component n=1 Tax=Acholeplasma equirhinis TaxID=555393 RepID=UPI00197A9659|nr:ECF transporter S component [Acholeplasma equirhinis]MBN3491196.1 ECF transporter S component [Acholeplasma equirhinis]
MIQKELRKLTLAATLTALSIVLDIMFKSIIPANIQFGLPYYAIPLVIGSLVLGPHYGAVMGFMSDLIGFYSNSGGFTYDPIYALQAVMWGVIPYLIARRNSGWARIGIAVLVSHLFATFCSSLADFVGTYVWTDGNIDASFARVGLFLPLRLYMLPVNTVIITAVTYFTNQRLEPVYTDFIGKVTIKEN